MSQIQDRISDFVQEINELVRAAALDAVSEALGGGLQPTAKRAPAPARRAATKAAKRGRKPAAQSAGRSGKRIRRTADQVEAVAANVQSHVQANPGQRLGDIAKALRMDTKNVRRPAFMLVEAGSLRTEGQRGGTRYFSGGGKRAAAKKSKPAPKAKKGKKAKRRTAKKSKRTTKAKAA